MSKNAYDLHDSRLATTDEKGHRVYIHPEDIKGKWKTRRKIIYGALLLFYLILPWIYINGKQWVLLDLANRQFYIFGHMFYGHDAPILVFLLLALILSIGVITALFGRVWCGYACPQTVFIDLIYRQIERWIEGGARQRKKLDSGPLGPQKIFKRTLKWFLFLIVTLHIVHSFLGYFVGTHRLFWITLSPPSENFELFVTMLIMTAILLFDFGWFREQFCIIACPYGRLQSVLMDQDSLVVGYDTKRGEPRRSPEIPKENEGDCINCFRCVKACPTGIDIRRGTQLECIACTMCIDACDEIMTKLQKPTGLIRYTTENELNGVKKKKLKIRPVIYTILVFIALGLFVSKINHRNDFKVKVLRVQGAPFQLVKDNESGQDLVLNNFKFIMHNYDQRNFEIDIESPDYVKVTAADLPFRPVDDNNDLFLFFTFNKSLLQEGTKRITIYLIERDLDKNITIKHPVEVKLVGPF